MNIEEMSVKDLLYYIKSQSYICSICDKVVYPTITEINMQTISLSLTQDKTQARGGLKNKVIQDNVCPECLRAMLYK